MALYSTSRLELSAPHKSSHLFFNFSLSLCFCQSFPEPLCFNPESGGFEVVSEARLELAQKIKAALRSQRKMPRIYKVTKQHSFIDIPLIPIVPPEGPEKMEIDTSFNVTVGGVNSLIEQNVAIHYQFVSQVL